MSDLNMPGHRDGVQGDSPPPGEQIPEGEGGGANLGEEDDDRYLGLGQALAPPD